MCGVLDSLQRGLERHQAGCFAEAEANYRAALAEDPANADALHLLGLLANHQGQYELGAERIRAAIALDAGIPFYHNSLGNALQALGRFAEAVACYQDALRLNPCYPEAHSNLGPALDALGRSTEALAECQEAVRLKPDFAEAYMNLGNIQIRLGSFAEAATSYRQAIRLRPHYPEAHSNLGNALLEQGLVEEAALCYENALRQDPNLPLAHWNKACLLLLRGDFELGFQEYEWRWVTGNAVPRNFPQPVWDGYPLRGRTILLHAEQGLGETVQFIRYAPLVKQAGGEVIVECQPRLEPLVRTVPAIDRVIAAGAALPEFDTHAGLLSLPRILRTRLGTIPAAVPYFTVDRARVEYWRERMKQQGSTKTGDWLACPSVDRPACPRFSRVGLIWAGSPTYRHDHTRSISLDVLAPLAQVPGVALFSLQRGPQAAELASAPFPIANLEEEAGEITDTAAILMNLDLLISVDTMAAHLAGALARPVWTLLSYIPDWRWLLGREDSPWYPTMRLFRQTRPGGWDSVVQRVAEALRDVSGV